MPVLFYGTKSRRGRGQTYDEYVRDACDKLLYVSGMYCKALSVAVVTGSKLDVQIKKRSGQNDLAEGF